jgi:uncharacterized surface protein with fasciclin (FAS1) repeats
MTHVDNIDKTEATGIMRIDQAAENVRIDVTLVFRNTDQLSIYTCGNFTVNFQHGDTEISTPPASTPTPIYLHNIEATNNPLTKSPEDTGETLIDILSNEEDLSVFVEALRNAAIDGLLGDEEQNLTTFAPLNTAFQEIPPSFLNELLSEPWILHLQNLVNYHITNGTILSTELGTSNLEMLNGELLTVGNIGEDFVLYTPLVPDINVERVDLVAVNGVSHVIDGVLLPTWVGTDVR